MADTVVQSIHRDPALLYVFQKSILTYSCSIDTYCPATGSSSPFPLSWSAIAPGSLSHVVPDSIPRSSQVSSGTTQQYCYKPPQKSRSFLPCGNSGPSSGVSTSAQTPRLFPRRPSLLDGNILCQHIRMGFSSKTRRIEANQLAIQ